MRNITFNYLTIIYYMETNYPFPTNINDEKPELIRSYKKLVSQNRDKNYPGIKPINTLRLCVYNVNRFSFLYNSNQKIFEFIKKINPDIISLIEYENYPYDKVFYTLNNNFTFMEQSDNYGILTMTPLKPDFLRKNLIDTNLINENTGFTHCCIRDINIITIHLDVFIESGRKRLCEIFEIHEYIVKNGLKNVILIGDFNEMNIDNTHPLYEEYKEDFKKRTGYTDIPNLVHNFLYKLKYIDVYSLFGDSDYYPKFSCWSGKLVDYCYIWSPTWNENIKIIDINLPMFQYSDHLPIVLDIQLDEPQDDAIYRNAYLDDI